MHQPLQRMRARIAIAAIQVGLLLAVLLAGCIQLPIGADVLPALMAPSTPAAPGSDSHRDPAAGCDGWTRHTARSAGFSFAYPPGWHLEIVREQPALPANSPHYRMVAPAAQYPGGNQVDILYDTYEIRPEQSLEAWVTLRDLTRANPLTLVSSRAETLLTSDGQARELLHQVERNQWGSFQRFYVRQDRLVLMLSAYVTDEEAARMGDALRAILATFRFAADAPGSLNALYGTDREWPTLDDLVLRLSPPTPATPPCDLACQDATAYPGAFETRQASRPEASPAPVQATMTAQALAQRARPTPTPPPTTPIPAGTSGYARYQGQASRFDNPPGVRYQVIYPTDGWRLQTRRTEAQLINITIPGCVLTLGESGIEHAGPPVSDSVRLGDLTWSRLTLPVEGEIWYRAQVADHVYRFQIDLPREDADEARQACQAAGESVLATFRSPEAATLRPDKSTP